MCTRHVRPHAVYMFSILVRRGREGGGGGVTKGEMIYTHVKYALKFKVSSIHFLQISVFLLTKC